MSRPGMPADVSSLPLLTGRFVTVVVAAFLYFLGNMLLLPIVPRYVEGTLGGNSITVGVVVGAYAVGAAIIRPLIGRLGDAHGRRILVVGGSAVVAVTTAMYGLVESWVWLLALRFVAGLGEAGVFVGAATAAQDLSPDDRRGEASSYFSVAIYGSLAIGPAMGEWMWDNWSVDRAWLAAAALVAAGGIIGLGIARDVPETSVGGPPPQGFFQRDALLPGGIQLLGLIPFAAFTAFFALHADDLGLSGAGQYFVVYGVVVLAVRILFARLPDRIGPMRSTLLALACIMIGVVVIGLASDPSVLFPAVAVFAFGMSQLFPGLFTVAVNNAPASQRTHAVGTFSLFFDASQGVGPAYLGILVFLFDDYRAAFFGGAVTVVGAVVMTLVHLPAHAERAAA